MRKYVPRPPSKGRSPLLAHPEKWSGQRRVLDLKSVAHLPQNSLNHNHYARALASPIRTDRVSKVIQVPRDLLLTLSIKRKDDQLWLLPNVTSEKSLSSNSYITNSRRTLSAVKKKWPQLASMEVLANNHTLTGIKDLRWSDKSPDVVNTVILEKLLELWGPKQGLPIKNDTVMSTTGDTGIQVINGVTKISLQGIKVDNVLYENLLAKINGNEVVISEENHQFIDYLMRFLVYNNN